MSEEINIEDIDVIESDPLIEVCYEILIQDSLLSAMNSLLTLDKYKWLNIYDDWLVHESALFHAKLKEFLLFYSVELEAFKNAFVLRTDIPKSNDPNYQFIYFLNEESFEQGSATFNFGCLKSEIDHISN